MAAPSCDKQSSVARSRRAGRQAAALGLVVAAGLPGVRRAAGAEAPVRAVNFRDTVVVYVPNLDLLWLRAGTLRAVVRLKGEGATQECDVDLAAACQPPAIVIRKGDGASYSAVSVNLIADGETTFDRRLPLAAPVEPECAVPLLDRKAAVEPGTGMKQTPDIRLPDLSKLRTVEVGKAARVLNLGEVTKPVRCEVNYPLVSAKNNAAISRQTAHPDDQSKRSVYVPLKSQLYDAATGAPTKVAHYLAEVPLDSDWLAGDGDRVVDLDPAKLRVHSTSETYKSQSTVGQGAGGLGQLVATVEVDARGNIYYSHGPAGLVRFNVSKAQFETPPIDLVQHFAQHLPKLETMSAELRGPQNEIRWEGYRIIVIHAGRVFWAPIINAVYRRDDRTSFVFSGVLSLPTDGWDDPQAFEAQLRFNVGSWPGCAHSFYDSLPDPSDRTRKLGRLFVDGDGIYITSYKKGWGGPWRLEINADGSTRSFGPTEPFRPTSRSGLPTNAAGLVGWWDYGTLTATRQSLSRVLTGTLDANLNGSVEINYDVVGAMRAQSDRYGEILSAMGGPSLAPVYMAVALPDQPGKLLGVAEYGYYLSTFDVGDGATDHVRKTYLKRDLGDSPLELPVAVGLGPYAHVWCDEGDSRFLYMGGYTGLTRLLYSQSGKPLQRFRTERLDTRLEVTPLDDAGPGDIKRFRYLIPGIDGRLFLTGTHTAARGGTAYSGGLMSFSTKTLDKLEKLGNMSRCFWTTNLRSRIVHGPEGTPVQELCLGGGSYNDSYAFTLDADKLPKNHDAKLFFYGCPRGGSPKDLYGMSLAPEGDEVKLTDHAFSQDRQYVVILQGTNLVTFHLASQRFVDGLKLAVPDGTPHVTHFFRPNLRLLRMPDDRLIFYVSTEASQTWATFVAIEVSAEGVLSLQPLLTLTAESPDALRRTFQTVHAFVPDLTHSDGSYDLVLGAPFRQPSTEMRILLDFIPPRNANTKGT